MKLPPIKFDDSYPVTEHDNEPVVEEKGDH